MPLGNIRIEQTKILVVEGIDENLFFSALITRLGLQGIQLLPIGGKTNLSVNLNALRIAPNFEQVASLGIVRDADQNAATAFQSVCDALRNANLPVPTQIGIASGANPQVTVIILPDSTSQGMLEDVCLHSIADDPLKSCVDQYFQCVQTQRGSLPQQISKAKIHAFLAAQPEPDKRLGEAAQAGYWKFDHPAFNRMIQFLRTL